MKENKTYTIGLATADKNIFYTGLFLEDPNTPDGFFCFLDEKENIYYYLNWRMVIWIREKITGGIK